MLGPWALGPLALRGVQGPAVMRFRIRRLMRFRFRVKVRCFSVGPLVSGALGP